MGKKLTQIEKEIAKIDAEIAVLQATKARLQAMQQAKPRRAKPLVVDAAERSA